MAINYDINGNVVDSEYELVFEPEPIAEEVAIEPSEAVDNEPIVEYGNEEYDPNRHYTLDGAAVENEYAIELEPEIEAEEETSDILEPQLMSLRSSKTSSESTALYVYAADGTIIASHTKVDVDPFNGGNHVTVDDPEGIKDFTAIDPISHNSFGLVQDLTTGYVYPVFNGQRSNYGIIISGDFDPTGAGLIIESISYQASPYNTEIPTGSWSDVVVNANPGEYLWTRVLYSNGYSAYSVARQGENGQNGNDGADGKDALTLRIISSNGGIFKNGDISTVLSAEVYLGQTKVTDNYDSNAFVWTRVSADPDDDYQWNSAHAGGAKQIKITASDVYIRATFFCDLVDTTTRASLL